jgi:hypothetical protein
MSHIYIWQRTLQAEETTDAKEKTEGKGNDCMGEIIY